MTTSAERKRRGAWYTPDHLVATIVDEVITPSFVTDRGTAGPPLCVVDPACGDGRFLVAAAARVRQFGGSVHVVGVDVDRDAVAAAKRRLGTLDPVGTTCAVVHADALELDWAQVPGCGSGGVDAVVGNPPFLSQMAAATTRGGASSRGGGPYADAAVEFLALAADLVDADGGRVGLVLPQSLLSARDARSVRDRYDAEAALVWSWWTGERVFDAQVLTCALAFEFASGRSATRPRTESWSHVVTSRRGVPGVPPCVGNQGAGTLGDRARLNANFRDEYYGMIPAVGDHPAGPKLITSGLIDPGRCLWGERQVTFAKRRFDRPRLDLSALSGKMPRWARDRLRPKVLVANQTKIIEAVADPDGSMLPGVPVVSAYPAGSGTDAERATWEIAAVLSSPVASAWAWQRSAGSGLSADAIRLGPVLLADVPWPAGDLASAVAALRDGDVRSCARAVHHAYGLAFHDDALTAWWTAALERIEARQPNVTAVVDGDPAATLRH